MFILLHWSKRKINDEISQRVIASRDFNVTKIPVFSPLFYSNSTIIFLFADCELSLDEVNEFKQILLYYFDFLQKQKVRLCEFLYCFFEQLDLIIVLFWWPWQVWQVVFI